MSRRTAAGDYRLDGTHTQTDSMTEEEIARFALVVEECERILAQIAKEDVDKEEAEQEVAAKADADESSGAAPPGATPSGR